MASNTNPHRAFRYHGTEGDNNGHSDWQTSQDGHEYAVAHQGLANRMWDVETISPSTADLIEAQNILTPPELLPNYGFPVSMRNDNWHPDSFGQYESMLPPPGPFVSSVNQVGNWDSLFSSTTSPSALHALPPALQTYGHAILNPVTMSENPRGSDFENNGAFNINLSATANDPLRLIAPDSSAIPPNGDYGNATNNEFFEMLVPAVRHSAPDSLLHAAMTTQHPLSDAYRSNTGISLNNIGLSFPAEQGWNLEPLRNETEGTLLMVPGYQSSNDALHVSDSSMRLEIVSSSASHGKEVAEPATAIERPLKQRKIMPKPSNSPAGTTGTFGGKDASVRTSKGTSQRSPLSKKKKQKISLMKLRGGACSACFASHVECSEEDPCAPCVKHANPLHPEVRCSRGSLVLSFEVFSPEFLFGHLRQTTIENSTDVLKFIDNEIIVALSTGPSHPPISLLVCEFIPPEERFLDVPDTTPKADSNKQTFATVRSLAWGILKRNFDQLKPRCLEHVKAISNRETVFGDPETVSKKIMRAILCFQQTDPIARTHDLLAKAIMVHRLHHVLGEKILFSLDSVDYAVASLQNVATGLPSRSRISARFLARQVKGTMNDLLIESTKALLDQYNGEAKYKRPETWLLCLMTHLILCMCAEQVQIQVDSFIVFRISKGGCDPTTIRRYGTEVCRRLEEVVLEHSWDLIRGKLRTLLNTRNPFKYGYHVDDGEVMKETELKLVNEIRQVMSQDEKKVFEKALDPYFGGTSRTPEDTGKFRESNSDRLLSKYLRKLY